MEKFGIPLAIILVAVALVIGIFALTNKYCTSPISCAMLLVGNSDELLVGTWVRSLGPDNTGTYTMHFSIDHDVHTVSTTLRGKPEFTNCLWQLAQNTIAISCPDQNVNVALTVERLDNDVLTLRINGQDQIFEHEGSLLGTVQN